MLIEKKTFFTDCLHIYILFSFGFAQPLFELLSTQAEFFAIRRSEPIDIFLLILCLVIFFPSVLVVIQLVAGYFGQRVRRAVHGFMIAGLMIVILLPVMKMVFTIPGAALLVAATFVGVACAIAYLYFPSVGTFFTILSPALLIFPVLFVFNSPVLKVVFPEDEIKLAPVEANATPPIIIIVFDEMSVTSLMDNHNKIDPIRYPNFANLARDGHWFRNATASGENTEISVPSILTGKYPKSGLVPTATDYPENLFTLLGSSYDLKVFESITHLCPDKLCENLETSDRLSKRMLSLLADLSAVYLHILLPLDLSGGLPDVTLKWKDFWKGQKELENGTAKDDKKTKRKAPPPLQHFQKFFQTIETTKAPSLFYLHMLLPHIPFRFLPSGKQYFDNEPQIYCLEILKWCDDEWAVIQRFQRHLLQVGFVDKILGQIINKLKAVDLYDPSLIIVTADHGVSYLPKDGRRVITSTNYQDIMPIPLIIKKPNQQIGRISDQNVELIDILPTIADAVGIEIPWDVDGASVFDPSLPKGNKKTIVTVKSGQRLTFDSAIDPMGVALKRKLALFGDGTTPNGLFKIGPHPDLIGRPINGLQIVENRNVEIELDQKKFFDNVNLSSDYLPAMITGRVYTRNHQLKPTLAVSVNGTIQAITKPYFREGKGDKFLAMLPESSFRNGKNDVDVFVIAIHEGRPRLEGIQTLNSSFSLIGSSGWGGETLASSEGRKFRVVKASYLHAYLDAATIDEGRLMLVGWAADVKSIQLPEALIIFLNGDFMFSGRTGVRRPGLAKTFGAPKLEWAGFRFDLPSTLLKNAAHMEMRIFAVSKEGLAFEVVYPKGYQWAGEKTFYRKKSSNGTFSLMPSDSKGEETIAHSDGRVFRVDKYPSLHAYLDEAKIEEARLRLRGWSADVKSLQLPQVLVIFMNGNFLFSGTTGVSRPGVANTFGSSKLEWAGFRFEIPLNLLEDGPNTELRMFALYEEGLASELNYPKGYTWTKK